MPCCHALARTIFHGDRGRVRKRYREAEREVSSLGLVLDAVTLWNTLYLDRSIAQLRGRGAEVRKDDLARVSPLMHAHGCVLGRYHLKLDEALAGSGTRPRKTVSSTQAGRGRRPLLQQPSLHQRLHCLFVGVRFRSDVTHSPVAGENRILSTVAF